MITTPLMLLVLCLAFAYNSKTTLNFFTFLLILLLNFGMIISGFVGEIGYIKDLQNHKSRWVCFFPCFIRFHLL